MFIAMAYTGQTDEACDLLGKRVGNECIRVSQLVDSAEISNRNTKASVIEEITCERADGYTGEVPIDRGEMVIITNVTFRGNGLFAVCINSRGAKFYCPLEKLYQGR